MFHGYGSIDENTVEFTISLYPDFRGYGIGIDMMSNI